MREGAEGKINGKNARGIDVLSNISISTVMIRIIKIFYYVVFRDSFDFE